MSTASACGTSATKQTLRYITGKDYNMRNIRSLAQIVGSVWGIWGFLETQSLFKVVIVPCVMLALLTLITILKLDQYLTPHWSLSIAEQEQVLAKFVKTTQYGGVTQVKDNYYRTLDSGDELARDMPIYVGKVESKIDTLSSGHFLQQNQT